ncbi:conserved hypothetical protein [Thiomonas sp. CB2]|nr:conserved hypothetical protein [Thiomonas sp. CB2]
MYQMVTEPLLALSGSVQFTQVDIDLGFFSPPFFVSLFFSHLFLT